MGNVDAKTTKTLMNPLQACCHDCSRFCLDECDCEYQCGCCSLKIQTHHTASAEDGSETASTHGVHSGAESENAADLKE
jgi:hypothetical protein